MFSFSLFSLVFTPLPSPIPYPFSFLIESDNYNYYDYETYYDILDDHSNVINTVQNIKRITADPTTANHKNFIDLSTLQRDLDDVQAQQSIHISEMEKFKTITQHWLNYLRVVESVQYNLLLSCSILLVALILFKRKEPET